MYWKIRKIWKKYPNYFWGDQLDVRYYLCEQIAKLRNKKILDVGCNIGVISGNAHSSNKLFGLDLDEKSVKIAQKLYPKHKYEVKDLWTLKGGKFDVIIFANMIEMFPKNTRQKLINKMASLLKKDGVMFITTPNRLNSFYKKVQLKLTPDELKRYLRRGFKIKKHIQWNPISIHCTHLAKIPGAYSIMKLISLIFKSKKSVSMYFEVKKK